MQETFGLRVLGESSTAVFFAVAPGHAGHTQVLVLFARGIEVSAERSTVDHIAFTVDLEGYDSERQRLTALGLSVEVAQHEWVKWRSLTCMIPRETKSNWSASIRVSDQPSKARSRYVSAMTASTKSRAGRSALGDLSGVALARNTLRHAAPKWALYRSA